MNDECFNIFIIFNTFIFHDCHDYHYFHISPFIAQILFNYSCKHHFPSYYSFHYISWIVILIIIQVCVSIVGTYVLLNAENSHWRWVSFGSGASIGIYLFIYCVYFYLFKTEMNGVVQAAYFFAESVSGILEVGNWM